MPCNEITTPKRLSGIDRVQACCVIDAYKQKCDAALRDAVLYRNMAERLQTEKRELKAKMQHSIETVRNFWHNSQSVGGAYQSW